MKKNQSGVSLISLVITIIVVIILAAVAFGSSTDTITNANFSTFTNNLGEVKTAFATVATTVEGQEAQKQISRTSSQVYNFVAKGGTLLNDETATSLISGDYTDRDLVWLPRAMANTLACTQLNDAEMQEVIDMKLPSIKVNTEAGTGKQVSYFVTREGTVFVWPPYEYENEYYVNADTKVIASGETETIKADGTGTTQPTAMYTAPFSFKVGNVGITVQSTAELANEQAKVKPEAVAAATNLSAVATIFYDDGVTALPPVGLESTAKVTATSVTTGVTPANTNQCYSIAGNSGVGQIVERTTANFESSF